MTVIDSSLEGLGYRPLAAADPAVLCAKLPHLLGGNWSPESLQAALQSGHQLRVWGGATGAPVAFAEFQCVLDECQLHSIAVLPGFQRQGVGRRLLGAVLQEASTLGLRRCSLDVREGNYPARRLYEARGFIEVGRRREYYPPLSGQGPREAALLCSLDLC